MANLGVSVRHINECYASSKQGSVASEVITGPYRDGWIYQEIKTTSSVPNWRSLIRLGSNATGTYTRTFAKFDSGESKIVFTVVRSDPFRGIESVTKARGSFMYGQQLIPTNFIDSTASDNLAVIDAYRKIRAEQTKMSGLVFLGEIREAIHMIKHPAMGLRNAVSNYASACRRRTKGLSKNSDKAHHVISDTWLEYRFGWSPFVSDIKDGIAAYNNVFSRTPRSVVKGIGNSASSSVTNSQIQYLFGETNIPWFLCDRIIRDDQTCDSTYRVGLSSTRKGNKADDLFDSFGVTIREFVPAAWELIPYSFLVDYFSNVGDILSAAATDTSGVTWTCLSRKRVNLRLTEVRPNIPRAVAIATSNGTNGFKATASATGSAHGRQKLTRFDRTTAGLISPRLTVTYPGEGSLKWLNIAALAASRFL